MRAVGTAKSLSERAGVPFGTLQNYLSGGEMKLSNAVAIARATGVRLAWLAAGEGPMRGGDQPAAPPRMPRENPGMAEVSHASAQRLGLTWQADPGRLARAYEQALAGFAVPAGHHPDARRLMQVTLLIYDELTEVEARANPPG